MNKYFYVLPSSANHLFYAEFWKINIFRLICAKKKKYWPRYRFEKNFIFLTNIMSTDHLKNLKILSISRGKISWIRCRIKIVNFINSYQGGVGGISKFISLSKTDFISRLKKKPHWIHEFDAEKKLQISTICHWQKLQCFPN